jgi:predicted membrane GTPase involved in stress response
MSYDWKNETDNIDALFETIMKHIPAPQPPEGTLQMQITSLGLQQLYRSNCHWKSSTWIPKTRTNSCFG